MIPKQLILCGIIPLLLYTKTVHAQCSVPASPPASSLTDQIISDGETLNNGITKWYKSSGTINSLTLNGGTFIVEGDLSITSLTINTGEIIIMPGASLSVGGSIILDGNAKIVNYGKLNVFEHIYMLGPTTASTPNCVINATPSSLISTPFNDIYIGDPNSTFINNGQAEFRSIFTTGSSSPGSVILNEGSETRLQSIFNNKPNAWIVPDNACVSVSSFSQVTEPLTNSSSLKLALGPGHNCSSCTTSPWGDSQVFTNTPSCASIKPLPIKLSNFKIINHNTCNALTWQTEVTEKNISFVVERSTNGVNFQEIARLSNWINNAYQFKDCNPAKGQNYYRIKIVDEQTKETAYSEILSIRNTVAPSEAIFPNPFQNEFTISLTAPISDKSTATLRNSVGQEIAITLQKHSHALTVHTPDNLKPGIYFLQLASETGVHNYRMVKK